MRVRSGIVAGVSAFLLAAPLSIAPIQAAGPDISVPSNVSASTAGRVEYTGTNTVKLRDLRISRDGRRVTATVEWDRAMMTNPNSRFALTLSAGKRVLFTSTKVPAKAVYKVRIKLSKAKAKIVLRGKRVVLRATQQFEIPTETPADAAPPAML